MISEVYSKIGGNYETAKANLMMDRLIEKYVFKFPNDPSFSMLEKAMAEKDVEAGFAASHTMKGVALNLAFSKLASASSDLTDSMRAASRCDFTWEQYEEMYAIVKWEYEKVLSAIREYQK